MAKEPKKQKKAGKPFKQAAQSNGESKPELERKFEFAKPEDTLAHYKTKSIRECYRTVFQNIKRSLKTFPDLAQLQGIKSRRSGNAKDQRYRIYLTDKEFRLTDAHWEVRLQIDDGVLMIKQGNGANDQKHTLDRTETPYELIDPHIGSIEDIERNSKKERKAPKALREIFADAKGETLLYPAVAGPSLRNKLVYYRQVEYKGRAYFVALEFAQDEGAATPLGGESYDIDQLELEVKRVVDVETGINILAHPDKTDVPFEEMKADMIEPLLNEEEALLCQRYGLKPVYHSKPKQGLKTAREIMATPEGMALAEAARQEHLNSTIWQTLAA